VRFVPPTAAAAVMGDAHSGGGQPAALVTASIDKSLVVWKPSDGDGGVWLPASRVGEVGGHTLGFYGGLVSPSGNLILAHGYLVRGGRLCGVLCVWMCVDVYMHVYVYGLRRGAGCVLREGVHPAPMTSVAATSCCQGVAWSLLQCRAAKLPHFPPPPTPPPLSPTRTHVVVVRPLPACCVCQGSFHVWRQHASVGTGGAAAAQEWLPGAQVGGHFGPVVDVTWTRDGPYLVSCSSDQTTRVLARLRPSPESR
jgi:hypothetical protein